MKIWFTTAAALLLISGCGERARFEPTQNVNAVSPSGQPAASYQLRVDPTSDPRITINVWSEGATREHDRTFVDLAVEIRNTGAGTVELDPDALTLELFNEHGAPLPGARLASVTAEKGSFTVGPHSAAAVRLRFELAVAVAPSQIGALRFRWGVVRDDGERYVQFTEFRREPEYVAAAGPIHYYHPVYGFYDPFFYGAPYRVHLNYYVPVRRVFIDHRSRPPRRR